MKRKNKDTTSRGHVYGLRHPTQNADIINDEMWRACQYRNVLVGIEYERRRRINALTVTDVKVKRAEEAVNATQGEIERLKDTIREIRIKARKKAEAPALRAKIKQLYATKKRQKAALIQEKKEARLRKKEAVDNIHEAIHDKQKQARAECGCYWGTYLLVETALDQSKKGPTPHTVSFEGEGSVGVEIQGGMSAKELFEGNTLLRIDPIDPKAWTSTSRAERRKLSKTVLSMRVGSDARKKPIWATWPMVMHRPIPDGWRIKSATVVRRRTANVFRNRLVLGLESPVRWCPVRRHGRGTVGIDIGWRSLGGNKLRVAYWADDRGGRGELLLDPVCRARFDKVGQLQSIRKIAQNRMKKTLVAILKEIEQPDWFRGDTLYLPNWKSPKGFVRLVRKWAKHRFSGDAAAFDLLEAWRYRDQHLWTWERHGETRAIGKRRERYRLFAIKMAERYTRVSMEDMDIDDLIERKPIGEDTKPRYAQFVRRTAAIGSLRSIIADACFMRQTEFVKTKTADTTRRCNVCGHINNWNQAAELRHECSRCHSEWDQDYNAAMNLCQQGCEWSGSAVGMPGEKQEVASAGFAT